MSTVPLRYRDADPMRVIPPIWRQLDGWDGQPINVLLWGGAGRGKSFASACVVRQIEARHRDDDHQPREAGSVWRWVNVTSMLNRMRADLALSSEYLNELKGVRFLILDDLGAGRDTGFTLDSLFDLVNFRYDWCKPTLVTTNMTVTELTEWHPRMASRLLDGLKLHFGGEDQRGNVPDVKDPQGRRV